MDEGTQVVRQGLHRGGCRRPINSRRLSGQLAGKPLIKEGSMVIDRIPMGTSKQLLQVGQHRLRTLDAGGLGSGKVVRLKQQVGGDSFVMALWPGGRQQR